MLFHVNWGGTRWLRWHLGWWWCGVCSGMDGCGHSTQMVTITTTQTYNRSGGMRWWHRIAKVFSWWSGGRALFLSPGVDSSNPFPCFGSAHCECSPKGNRYDLFSPRGRFYMQIALRDWRRLFHSRSCGVNPLVFGSGASGGRHQGEFEVGRVHICLQVDCGWEFWMLWWVA